MAGIYRSRCSWNRTITKRACGDPRTERAAGDCLSYDRALAGSGIDGKDFRAHWSGEASSPRHCTAPSTATSAISNTTPDFGSAAPSCIFQFDLTADQLTSGDLVAWLTPHPAKRPWYLILNSDSKSPAGPSPLLAVRAHGSLHIGQLGLKKLAVTQLVTKVELDGRKIALTGLRAQVLQGTHQGNWTIDLLSGNPSAGDVSSGDPSPTNASASVADNDVSKSDASAHGIHYHGSGTLNGISLAQADG